MQLDNPLGSRNRSSLISLVLGCVVFILAVAVALKPLLRNIDGFSLSSAAQSDFALAIYYPVRAWLDGVNPYDGSSYLARYPVRAAFAPYLPSTLLIHLPFGLLPVGVAGLLYLLCSICLILLLSFLSFRFNRWKVNAGAILLVAAALVISRPGRQHLFLGQVTLEAVLGTYLTLYYADSSARLSGLGLALTLSKPSYGFPLALVLLMRGNHRVIGQAALFAFLLNAPVALVMMYQAGGLQELAQQFSAALGGFQVIGPAMNPAMSPYRIDAVALVGRWLGRMPEVSGQLLVGLAVLGPAVVALRARPASAPQPFVLWTGVVCTAVLLCGYHQQYDLLLLTMPFIGLAARPLSPSLDPARMRAIRLLLLTFLFYNYTASDSILRRFGFLVGGDLRFEALVADPRALALASLNGLALLALFCSFVVTLIGPTASKASARYGARL